jgi:hypothetical protein
LLSSSQSPRFGGLAPWPRTAARLFELGCELQSMKGVAPHVFEESGDGAEPVRARSIEAVLLVRPHLDEAGLGERSELERDGPERDVREGSMNRSGRELTMPDEAEDFTPAR